MVSKLSGYGIVGRQSKLQQAFIAPSIHRSQYGTYQKEQLRPTFVSTTSRPQATNETREMYDTEHDTEFEEDLSDFEEYSGRRSEDSVSGRWSLRLECRSPNWT